MNSTPASGRCAFMRHNVAIADSPQRPLATKAPSLLMHSLLYGLIWQDAKSCLQDHIALTA